MSASPQLRLLLLVTIAVLAACAAPSSSGSVREPGTGGTTPPDGSGPGSEPPASPSAPNGIPDEIWHAILADMSERLGTRVTEPSVLIAEAVTWTDGSLGCPEPGGMYTQALVDGYQVVVEVDGQEYDYRVGRGTDVRLCENAPPGG